MSALHYRRKTQERELARRQLAALEAADTEAANHKDLNHGGALPPAANAASSKDGSFKGDGNGGVEVLPTTAEIAGGAAEEKSAVDLSSASSETGDKYQGVKESPEERRQRIMVRQRAMTRCRAIMSSRLI